MTTNLRVMTVAADMKKILDIVDIPHNSRKAHTKEQESSRYESPMVR